MLDLITGGNGTLAIVGAVIAAVVAVIWKVFRTGRQVERGKHAAEKNKGWVEANDHIGEANAARLRARRNADHGGLHDDDGYKRPGS